MRTTRKVNDEELKEARKIGEPFVREYEESDYCELEGTCDRDRLNKLGQLEDIEEELGIDLITLFKVLKNGIYYGYDKDDIFHYEELELKYWKYWYLYVGGIGQVCFEDYGKTWALSEEELL